MPAFSVCQKKRSPDTCLRACFFVCRKGRPHDTLRCVTFFEVACMDIDIDIVLGIIYNLRNVFFEGREYVTVKGCY